MGLSELEPVGSCYVYIVLCKDGSYYTGYTTNLIRRIEEHKTGKGAKHVKTYGFEDYAFILCPDHRTGRRLELKIKRLSRVRKTKFYKDINIREAYLSKVMEMG